MQKIALFDIDHTIFDTNLYRENLYKNLSAGLKYDLKHFLDVGEKIYKELRKTQTHLNPDQFLEAVLPPSKTPSDLEKSKLIFWEKKLYESSIYPDVKDAFSYLAKHNFLIGIFSTGDLKHQNIKIASLKEYLAEKHIHISLNKMETIEDTFSLYKDYQTYLIDDYPAILQKAKEHNKNVFTIFIKRESKFESLPMPENFKPDATITNLSELPAIIETDN